MILNTGAGSSGSAAPGDTRWRHRRRCKTTACTSRPGSIISPASSVSRRCDACEIALSSEMALPNHPDVAYDFVKMLRDCGYTWVLVGTHGRESSEWPRPGEEHLPHRLVAQLGRRGSWRSLR